MKYADRDSRVKTDPFYSGTYAGHDAFAIDATTRIERVKTFDWNECELALKVPDLQKTVRVKIEARMRKIWRPDGKHK